MISFYWEGNSMREIIIKQLLNGRIKKFILIES